MPDYRKSKIYAIRSRKSDDICIGSTTQRLSSRLSKHVSDYKRWKEGKDCYRASFAIIEQGEPYIELLEEYPCNSVEALTAREYHLIRTTKCVNKLTCGAKLDSIVIHPQPSVIEQLWAIGQSAS